MRRQLSTPEECPATDPPKFKFKSLMYRNASASAYGVSYDLYHSWHPVPLTCVMIKFTLLPRKNY